MTCHRTTLIFVLLPLAATAPLSAQEDFCQSQLGVSHLLTPGTALCETIGQSTTVTLFDNSVIEWDSIVLTPGQRLEFAFANPEHTVVNQSLGTARFSNGTAKPTFIGGTLSSNGNVVILSPNNWLQFSRDAQIDVGSLTASGLGGNSEQFFAANGPIELDATPLTNPTTLIRGQITTTQGDVLVAGRELEITADIDAAGSVTAVTGRAVRLDRSNSRAAEATGGSQIIQGGTIKARGDIEFITQQALSMTGELAPGNGRGQVFAKVDENGEISVGAAGLTIRGTADFSMETSDEIAFIKQDEGDNPGGRSPAVNEFPTRGSRTSSRARPTSSTITARAPSVFTSPQQTGKRKKQVASSKISGIQKRAFYGTRGTVTNKRPPR